MLNLFLLIILSSCQHHTLNWDKAIDQATQKDSWATWQQNYAYLSKRVISKELFMKTMGKASCQNISPEDFLALNIENHRLDRYPNARSAEEAYPLNDRPRGDKDISSVNYFLQTTHPVSPITVIKFIDKERKARLVKLDGVHRLMAAAILRQSIRVCWLNLINLEDDF